MSSDSHATINYTSMSSYEVIVNGYYGMPMDPLDPYVQLVIEAPPSPDYIPGHEAPPSPDYIPGPEAPLSPDYIPGPEYPEYLPPDDDVLPAEEQPLPAAVSPTAVLPGYITESEPEIEPEEDDGDDEKYEEDSIEYPTSEGDDDGDDLSEDDADDDDEKEEEEHLALIVPTPALYKIHKAFPLPDPDLRFHQVVTSPAADSAPRVTSHVADEGSMQHTISELTALCTSLQRQYSKLRAKFQAQEEEIVRLKERVQVLKDREGVAAKQSGDDAPIKGKSINEGEAAAERISNDSVEIARVLTSMDAATVLAGGIDVPAGSGSIPTAGPPATVISTSSELVPVEDVYVQALQVKHPIIDWKVRTEGQRSYWKIIRLGGSSACYQFFVDLLKQLDREDLNQLWALVKEYLSIRPATSEKEMELWVELKRLDLHASRKRLSSQKGFSTCDDQLQALG
nr:hypothetical protein [Tanacetum cinerariifolium]